ncbi:hypothetical protein BH23THE1_BH23THE1_13480 [soil metagenome]
MKTDKEKLTTSGLTTFECEYNALFGLRSATVPNPD